MSTAVEKIDEAVAALNEAKRLNDIMQKECEVGSNTWHKHESIDDKLHDALAALGQ